MLLQVFLKEHLSNGIPELLLPETYAKLRRVALKYLAPRFSLRAVSRLKRSLRHKLDSAYAHFTIHGYADFFFRTTQ